MSQDPPGDELAAVVRRYARRDPRDARYSLLQPDVQHATLQRQRALLTRLARAAAAHPRWTDLSALRLAEVGCGNGCNLLELLRFGFAPAHLVGLELLPMLAQAAREQLPQACRIIEGDARVAPLAEHSQDLVLASTVFTSLLDDSFQQQLAHSMWRWLKPGGAVIWYDFTVNNPRNPDVRGVPLKRIASLFPQGHIDARRLTLAPPLARVVCRWHPGLYGVFHALPLLRTHVLAWIGKPG